MSQISPPIRIVIIAAVAFLAAYMLLLRPKDEPVPAAAAPAPNVQTGEPAVSEPGKVAEAAQAAADAANAQLQAQESIDGVDAGESAAGTATKKDKAGSRKGAAVAIPADLKGVPKPVAKAIAKEKTLVLLFWNDRAVDDREVLQALRKVDRWDGRVFVHAAPIKSISKYGRITRGADVEQSPTVVVVDTELRAERVVGYVDATTIDQMVVDAFRNSGGVFTDAYLREINQVCTKYAGAIFAMPESDTLREMSKSITTFRGKWSGFQRSFSAVKAPAKWRGLKRASVGEIAAASKIWAQADAFLGPNPSVARTLTAIERFDPRLNKLGRSFNRRMDENHVLTCGSDA